MKRFARALLALGALALGRAADAAPPVPPKLLVLVSVDQFSSDLFEQYRSSFTGGLARLTREGGVFANGFQSHAATETCPGHSTLLSGRHPSGTGIVANAWIDSKTGQQVYCVFDPTMSVPHQPGQPRGPGSLRAPTLADWLKAANPASRVFSVSGKDRAAIAMVGKAADGVFWWDDANGFTTYVPKGATEEARLAPAAPFNRALFAAWKSAPPDWVMKDKRCGALNGVRTYGEETLDHQVPPISYRRPPRTKFETDARFFQNFDSSPELDETTLALAKNLIKTQGLGHGQAVDLIAISLSGVDRIGHRFGTQGPEMCDQLAHLDAALGDLMATLERSGAPFALVLTADHGSIDAAERVADRGVPAIRVMSDAMWDAVNADLRATFQLTTDAVKGNGDQGYILTARENPILRAEIEARAASDIRARSEVFAVFTRADIQSAPRPGAAPVDELSLAQRIAESFDPERSGDLFIVFKPYASFGQPKRVGDAIAGHGSVWNYDRRVPILFWRSGGAPFEQALPIETVDIAPTLAALVKVAIPEVDGRCIDLDPSRETTCPVASSR